MSKFKIFVSGAQRELKSERRAVKDLILQNPLLKEYFNVFLFEDVSAKSKSAKKTYMDEVGKSDIYIGLFGNEYGTVDKDNMSATEREFYEAHKRNKKIFIFIKDDTDARKNKRMKALIKEIQNPNTGYTYKSVNSLIDLKNSVHESLVEFLRDEGIVGKTIFDENICKNATFSDIDEEQDIKQVKHNIVNIFFIIHFLIIKMIYKLR